MKKVNTLEKIGHYLNPISHLGERRYSIVFPVLSMASISIFLELFVHYILRDPAAVGVPAIVLYIALIIYFAFRCGVRGGVAAVVSTIVYYLYIIYDRQYTGEQLTSGVTTTLILGSIYLVLAYTIGWLKQTIDELLERQVNAKGRLLTIIRQLPVGIMITDTTGAITEVNAQFRRIAGDKIRPGDYVGSAHVRLKYPQSGLTVPIEQLPVLQALRNAKVVHDREFMITIGGKKRVVLVSAAPIYDQRQRTVAAVSIVQDVTATRELEKRKDDFVNMASHELKTPITSLVLYLTILKRRLAKRDYARAGQAVEVIERQTANLLKLINNLLEVSRHQVGKLTYTKENFRLDDLVQEAVDSLNDETTQQNIILVSRKPITVYGDRFRIYQVVTNLITNAVKYTNGKGDIQVRVGRATGSARVSVKDFGIGIPRSEHKKIFEKLYQVGGITTNTYPGFGMGLFIAKEIINRHKGRIWVESGEGKGATFHFTLPLSRKSD